MPEIASMSWEIQCSVAATEVFVSFNLEIRTERPVYTQPEIAVALALSVRAPQREMMFALATAPLGHQSLHVRLLWPATPRGPKETIAATEGLI